MNIELNKSLLPYNTFHIDEYVSEFAEANSEQELLSLLQYANTHDKEIRILGGGSNVLLTQPLRCLLIHNNIKGVQILHETEDDVSVRFMSGEIWHDCVLWCVENNFSGIENLSLIPGTIGAAPIQNIGAYGVELQDVFYELEAIDFSTYEKKIFTRDECQFGYRDSVFKNKEKGKYFILSVTLKLSKKSNFNVSYGDIKKIIEEDFKGKISTKNISEAVIKIRKSKLPDPAEIGNAGSFFKNPVIENSLFEKLQKLYPEMPFYKVENGIKIPAAWLIEKCNWKGYNAGKYGVHTKQALVLVNHSDAKGSDILQLSENIITSVQQQFNIQLEREVNIW